jgi:hypothetical protein
MEDITGCSKGFAFYFPTTQRVRQKEKRKIEWLTQTQSGTFLTCTQTTTAYPSTECATHSLSSIISLFHPLRVYLRGDGDAGGHSAQCCVTLRITTTTPKLSLRIYARNTTQHNAAQRNTTQHNATQRSTSQRTTPLRSIPLRFVFLYSNEYWIVFIFH